MSGLRTWFGAALVTAVAGCGGGGGGGSTGGSGGLSITSTALPETLSGQVVDHQIPFVGGAGGPFLLQVLAGELPDGVNLDASTVALVGRALQDGVFDFELKLTDTGAQPFLTTTATFHWEIGIGALVFGTPTDLPDQVYGRFTTIELVVAGGSPPYSCEVVDDPSNPNDENLPSGLAIPPDSTTIVGSPEEAKPGDAPFLVTIRARDHADNPSFPNPLTVQKTFELVVLVPPVVVVTTSLPDGKCGTNYAEVIEFSDGVAPFRHHVVVAPGSAVQRKGEVGTPDGVAKGAPDSAYAAETDEGPSYDNRFPEGVLMVESTGALRGVPRRRGTFVDWTYHIQSTSLPAAASQNVWRNFTFSMDPGTPPAMALDTSVLAPGNTSFAPPNNLIPELEVTIPYTAQFAAVNGVPMDGLMDAPLDTEALPDPTEEEGKYAFVGDFGPAGVPPGMTFSIGGTFEGTPTQKSGLRTIGLTVTDEQLPTSATLGFPNSATGQVRFTVGPDAVVITETLAGTSSTSYDDVAYGFGDQTVEIYEPFSGTPTVRALDDAKDMVAGHSHPLGGTLAASLSGIDFLQTSVNPTWWAYDVANLCALGARAGRHGDWQRKYQVDALHSDHFRRWSGGGAIPLQGADHASNLAVELPSVRGTTPVADAGDGVYTDGGLLYGYDNDDEFGFFIVRKDARIEIPIAFEKPSAGGTYEGFGDGWVTTNPTHPSGIRRPQITVSPDGRFAAVKLKEDVANFGEDAATSKVALFSLTGERPFGGASFTVISTGSGGTSASGGVYLYGDSMTLTNRFLYFLCGDYQGQTNGNLVIYSRHYVYRHEILGGASSAALLGGGSIPSTRWSNTTSSPLAVHYHKWMTPGASAIATPTSTGITPYATSFTSPSGINPHFFAYNYANFSESSMAPHPFRVSADGNACAMLGAPDSFAGVTGTNFMKYYLFVDFDSGSGTPAFREISGGTPRRFGTATRIGGYACGQDTASFYSSSSTDRLYGWYDGPATQLEVSDDGTRVAAVYNDYASTWSTNGRNNERLGAEELLVFRGTAGGSDPWSSVATTSPTGLFSSPVYWRVGNLAFTRDGNGLVFWAGFSNYDGNYNGIPSYTHPPIQTGTLYATDLSSATTNVTSILAQGDGGGTTGVSTHTPSNPLSINGFTNWNGAQGCVNPMGGFYSNDGNFLYVRSWSPLNNSDPTLNRLVGVNVSAVSSSTIGGRTAMRAFAPSWPTRYGFGPEGYSIYSGNVKFHRGVSGAQSLGCTTASADNGVVFFAGYYQRFGPYTPPKSPSYEPNNTTYYYPAPVHPIYYGDYGGYGGDVFAFDANQGGNVVKLTSLGSSSSMRFVTYLQPDPSGRFLSVVYSLPTPAPYDARPHLEQVALVSGIESAGGTLTTTGVTTLEASSGRAAASVAHGFLGSKLYYGFTTASNENNMLLVEKTTNLSGTAVTNTVTLGGALGGTSGQARFAVLHAGR
jgi:hypothetical protein